MRSASGRPGIWLPLADARRVEDAVEDDGRGLLSVGVEDVGPGGNLLHVELLARDLKDRRTDPGARVPDGRIHVDAEGRFQGQINSSIGIASVRPEAGSTTA